MACAATAAAAAAATAAAAAATGAATATAGRRNHAFNATRVKLHTVHGRSPTAAAAAIRR